MRFVLKVYSFSVLFLSIQQLLQLSCPFLDATRNWKSDVQFQFGSCSFHIILNRSVLLHELWYKIAGLAVRMARTGFDRSDQTRKPVYKQTSFDIVAVGFIFHSIFYRKLRPWIVTYGHRPMYCSNENGDDCTHLETLVRVGLPFTHFFGLEDLFYKYGVDVEIWAHEHCYERLWPIYNYKVMNGSHERPYTNPKAPVHVITGAAGNKEGREPFVKKIPEWSAFHSQVRYFFKHFIYCMLIVFFVSKGLRLHSHEGIQRNALVFWASFWW